DGVIYIGTADEVIAVDDGEEKWDENPDIGNFSNTDSGFALVLADESSGGSAEIIVGSNDKDLYAVDADNGNQSWEEDVDASVLNNPAVDSDRGAVYVAAGEKVVAYDLETRDEEWTVDAEDIAEEDNIDTEDFDINEASPAVGEDMLYVASFEGTLYALDLENDGKVEWSYDTEGKISASPVIGTDETVYLGSGNDEGDAGTFHAVRDGEAEWKIDIDASVNTTAAVTGDGEIYFGDSKGTFYMVDAEEKANEEKVKEKQELDGTIESGVTVDDDGTIYVGCDGNREELSFYSLAGDSGLADSPWPKIGADLRNTSRKQ
ncbi:MAG: PQQ-binding-like beta-propeller repeat protein, partial [Halanaerobiales bacterium]